MPEITREYGIISPNGQSHWGSFIQRPLATEQDRSLLSIALHRLAHELGFDEDEFVNRFRWTTRTVTEEDTRFTVDDPSVAPGLQQQAAPVPSTVTPEPIQASE
jgi:hypothetical protein